MNRREFLQRATAVASGRLAAPAIGSAIVGATSVVSAQPRASSGAAPLPLEIGEWSYFWIGGERAELARGVVVSGKQMYVEYQIPVPVRHPYPIVLVHGGGGQGLDWMGTPDGRRGWSTHLLQEGYAVYVVDRPGHGRSPFHPELHGPFPQPALTLETISSRFTPMSAKTDDPPRFAHLHHQWPGTGAVGTPELAQLVASQGGSYVGGPGAGPEVAHAVWRERGAMLLDKIGAAIIMTHSAGGPFGWLVAEARPSLVKGIVVIEGGGQPFAGANRWGMSTIPVTYDPPVADPSEIKTKKMDSPEPGVSPYVLQEEPARKLKHLQGIPMVIVTAEGSFASPGNPAAVAFLKQAGCTVEELRLGSVGVHGNGHMMMVEKNNRDVLQPILNWIDKNVATKGAAKTEPSRKGTALTLADQGYFWVGAEAKKMPYGNIVSGQMFVQYLTPARVQHPYSIVLVHGGGGQGTHYMGLGDGEPGWAHYFLKEGYKVFIVDRPGHGRAPYHPDALGPIGPHPTYGTVTGDFKRAATGPNKRWNGSGEVGDAAIDRFQAGQNAAPQDNVLAQTLWASRGAELLDKIGPAIIQTHSAGGPFGWLVADQRPNLVKAVVCFEGGGAPFTAQTPWGLTAVPLAYDPPVSDPKELATRDISAAQGSAAPAHKLQVEPARKLKNLVNVPVMYLTAENSGRLQGPSIVAFLKQAGCPAEDLQLKDLGILGNGHFAMIETNSRQVFEVIHGWIQKKVSGTSSQV